MCPVSLNLLNYHTRLDLKERDNGIMHPHFDTLNLECFQHSVSEGSLSHTRDIHIAKQERVRPGSAWETTSPIPSNLSYIDLSNSHSTTTHMWGSNIDRRASSWTVPSPPPLGHKCEGFKRRSNSSNMARNGHTHPLTWQLQGLPDLSNISTNGSIVAGLHESWSCPWPNHIEKWGWFD